MKHSVQVTILGQQYTIKSQLDPDEVKKVAAFVNVKLEEVAASHKVVDTLHTAVLALLNVSGEYLDLCREEQGRDEEVQLRLEQLADKIEFACSQSGESG